MIEAATNTLRNEKLKIGSLSKFGEAFAKYIETKYTIPKKLRRRTKANKTQTPEAH